MSYYLPLAAEDIQRRLLKITDLCIHEAVYDQSNIIVNLGDHFIENGSEIKFRAPANCSDVTRLHVQYEGENGIETKIFAFADANGNDIGEVDNLFAEGAIVKVILDLESVVDGLTDEVNGAAFVQNANTNKYLEDRLEGLAAAAGGQTAFVATYNETSLEDIYNAYLEDKDIILKDIEGGYLAVPVSITQTAAMFTATLGLVAWSYTVLETGWNKVQHSLESSDNKEINLIDGGFNHNTYPSSKAVVDYFNKNRTHYTEGTGPSLSKVIEESDNVMLNGSPASIIGDINQDITNGKISIDGNIYDFSVDKCFAIENYSICIVPHVSNPAISTKTIYITATRLSNGSAAYLPVGTKVEIYLPDESPLVVHQLDEKYIPDSIARISDIFEQDPFGAVYYESLSLAIADINNSVKDNSIEDLSLAKVKVSSADNGVTTITLLDDISASEKIYINKDVNLVLNGKVLNFTESLIAGLSFGTGTSCHIDGTVAGSAVSKTVTVAPGTAAGSVYSAILSNGDRLTVSGGSYNVSGAFFAEILTVFGSSTAGTVLLENCSVSIVDSDPGASSNIYGLYTNAPAILKNVVINADTANGRAYAIRTKHNLEIYDSDIKSVTRPKWSVDGNATAYGIFVLGDSKSLVKIKDTNIHADAQNDNAEGSVPYAIGILLSGTSKVFLENTNVAGTHSGIQCGSSIYGGDELYVRGGVLRSFSHGGIYATGGSKVCVRDAVLRCGDYDGIFDYTSDEVFESGYLNKPFSNLYVAGEGTVVYLDGCSLDSDESKWGLVLKNGTNCTVNVSNTTVVQGTELIRTDDPSFRVNVGTGTNLTPESFFTPGCVNFTNEMYRKLYEDEICEGSDYDALVKLNSNKESALYYSSLLQALSDINNGVSSGSTSDKSAAKVKVFTTEEGVLTVKLVDNTSESSKIDINKDIELVLNGKTITFPDETAYLSFNAGTSCKIDGTAAGSAINQTLSTPTANCQIILVSGDTLSIDGGSYYASGDLGGKGVLAIKAVGSVKYLTLANCSINVLSTGTSINSTARAVQSQAANTIVNNVMASVDTYGKADTLLVAGNTEINNSNISVKTRAEFGTIRVSGINNYGANLKVKDSIIHADAMGCDIAHNHSVGIYNDGITFLDNTNITGTHSAVQALNADEDELYVNGGILTGYYFGGVYAIGTTYIRDAILRCGNYDGIFDYTSEDKFTSNYLKTPHCNLYVAGNGTNVYLDGCTLDGKVVESEIAIKGEGNNIVNISNSTVFDVAGKPIYSTLESNKLNVGIGTNITTSMIHAYTKNEFTGKLYRKLHKDETCEGNDYNALIGFLNSQVDKTTVSDDGSGNVIVSGLSIASIV